MARISMRGLSEYTKALSKIPLGLKEEIIGPAVYQGAALVATAVRDQIEALPTDTRWGTEYEPRWGPTPLQKEGLLQSFGITPMRGDDGYYNVKLGFDGYNKAKSQRWPHGQPNVMVARSVEAGTSFMLANPFLKTAVSGARRPALQTMQKAVDDGLKKLME